MSGKTPLLTHGKESFTLLELLAKTAAHKGLKLDSGSSRAMSEPIAAIVLDQKMLRLLAERKFRRHPRPDCQDTIFTLVDENPQEVIPGWNPSNVWNFKLVEGRNEFDLQLTLYVGIGLSIEDRGFRLWPKTCGTGISPADHLPNFRMFKAIVENGATELPRIVNEIAESDGSVVVTYTDLELGGIRRIGDLFTEFFGTKEVVRGIARHGDVFDPQPYPFHQQPGDELFITESAQPKIVRAWRAQLNGYQESLTV